MARATYDRWKDRIEQHSEDAVEKQNVDFVTAATLPTDIGKLLLVTG